MSVLPTGVSGAGRFAALQKQMGGHTDIYAVDNHSCVINAAMEELAKPRRSVEQKTVKRTRRSGNRAYEYSVGHLGTLLTGTLNGCIMQVEGG